MNIFEAAHALFVEHFGEPFSRRPRSLDLRGFSMTRAEAARWMDAVDPPSPDDSHPTRGDILLEATREELLFQSYGWHKTPRERCIAALYIAAARGPDFKLGDE